MQANVTQAQVGHTPLKALARIELLIAALFPVAAILVLGVVGTKQIASNNGNSDAFTFLVLLCASIVFLGELGILTMMHQHIKQSLGELLSACHGYLAGNKERRATIGGNDAFAMLAQCINAIIKLSISEQQQLIQQAKGEITQVHNQVYHLLQEVGPVLQGDLRVKARLTNGAVGTLSDVCNYLIEELIQLVRWTRFSSEQVIGTTSDLLERSIDLAQTAEHQMLRLSGTSEAIEKVVAFAQRMSSTLQLNVDIALAIRERLDLQRSRLLEDGRTSKLLEELDVETQRQVHLLEYVLRSTQDTVTVAESTIDDIYSLAQRIHQSSTAILNTAERVSSLAGLAEQWRNSVTEFRLPADTQMPFENDGYKDDPLSFAGPTPTSPHRSIRI